MGRDLLNEGCLGSLVAGLFLSLGPHLGDHVMELAGKKLQFLGLLGREGRRPRRPRRPEEAREPHLGRQQGPRLPKTPAASEIFCGFSDQESASATNPK